MKKFIIVIVILGIVGGGFYLYTQRKNNNDNQPEYQVETVKKGTITVKIIHMGTIQPYTRVEVKPPLSGRVDSVKVSERDIVKEGDILAWISSEERVALIDAARAQLEEAQQNNDAKGVEKAKQAYQIAEKAYRPIPITASISGEIIKRECEPGQNVTPTNTIFVLSDSLVANVEVDETDIGKVEVGQNALITLDAFPNERVKSRVVKISREGRESSGIIVYDVMVDPVNVPHYWSSGMTANVEFILQNKKDILVIPERAVREQQDTTTVILKGSPPKPQVVKLGITDGKMIEVVEGLSEGDSIIVSEINRGLGSPEERSLFGPRRKR